MENLDDPFAIQITISLFLSLSLEENHLSISPGAYTEQTYRKTFSLSDLDLYFVISLLFCFHMSWRWPWWCRYCQVKAMLHFGHLIIYHNLGQHPSHYFIFLQNTMTKNHHDWLKIINIKQKFANSISPAGQLLFHWPILHTETKKFGQFGANIVIFAINEHAVYRNRKMGYIHWLGIHTNPDTSWQGFENNLTIINSGTK